MRSRLTFDLQDEDGAEGSLSSIAIKLPIAKGKGATCSPTESFVVNMSHYAFPDAGDDISIYGVPERPPGHDSLFEGVAFQGKALFDALSEFPRHCIILKKTKQIPQVMVEFVPWVDMFYVVVPDTCVVTPKQPKGPRPPGQSSAFVP